MMMMMSCGWKSVLVIGVMIAASLPGETSGNTVSWCYNNSTCGPSTWPTLVPTCGGGVNYTQQSPININSSNASSVTRPPFVLSGWSNTAGKVWTMVNNGHSVSVSIPPEANLSVSGAWLSDSYLTDSFHFHWGSTNGSGSEHAIDGQYYPVEMHIVNYKRSYGNLTAAKTYSDGIAVLGVFFQIGNNFTGLDPIISALSNVSNYNMNVNISAPNFETFLPGLLGSNANYFRYEGSLTTPTCDQAVIWSVFQTPLSIGPNQLSALQNSLYFEDHTLMVNNFRPVQNLNNRTVVCVTPATPTVASTTPTTTAAVAPPPRAAAPLLALALACAAAHLQW